MCIMSTVIKVMILIMHPKKRREISGVYRDIDGEVLQGIRERVAETKNL